MDKNDLKNYVQDLIGVRFDKNVENIIDDYFEKMEFYPASKDHHSNCIGGWMQHTGCVVRICRGMAHSFILSESETESLLFCAFFHDIGKLCEFEWVHNLRGVSNFPFVKRSCFLRHEALSIFLLGKYNIGISEEEMAAILYHGGLCNNDKEQFYKAENKILLILHAADNLSAKISEAQ